MMMIMMILMMTDEFAKIFSDQWWRDGLKSTMRVWPITASGRTDLRTRDKVELGVKEQLQ